VQYNPGTIKAALMRTADTFPTLDVDDENTHGQGMVNAKAAYDILTNGSLDVSPNLPKIVEMTPHFGPLHHNELIFKNIQMDLAFSVYSSHPAEVTFEITGDLVNIVSSPTLDSSLYSQVAYLPIDTTGVASGSYTGQIIAKVGNDESISTYTFEVGDEPTGKALFDLGHTNWDATGQDILTGANTGEMVKLGKANGIFIEAKDTRITSALLNNYDILWMPDPLSIVIDPDDPNSVSPNPLFQDEIDAIVDFVANGGSLLVDFNGYLTDIDGNYGTNSSGINNLISHFDITTSTTAVSGPSGSASVANNSSPVGGASQITHYGNYLTVGPSARVVAQAADGPTVAVYDKQGEGRVLVSSTNFWLDNFGLTGASNYASGDRAFASGVWNWLAADKRIYPVSSSVSETKIEAEFKITENGILATNPEVKLLDGIGVTGQLIPVTNTGAGQYKFSYVISTDGEYHVEAVFGTDYLAWEIQLDRTPPVVVPQEGNLNLTGLEAGVTQRIKFTAFDAFALLNKNHFSATLDGDASAIEDINYRDDTQSLVIKILPQFLTNQSYHWYVLTINSSDGNGNSGDTNHWFFVGENEPDPPPVYTPPETTTSTTETTTDKSDGDDSPYPFVSLVLSLGVILIAVFHKRRKS
jgi:hypothetical protein